MPSIYVHTMFSRDVKNKLDKKTQELINQKEQFYKMFSQSFDNLYYYNFLSLRKGKDIRGFGTYCHRNNTQKYLFNIINYIKDNNLKDNAEVMCYLYGSLNHYAADSIIHPFIYYKTGRYSSARKEQTKKYIGIHADTELRLDAYFYEKETSQSFKKYKIYNDLYRKLTFSKDLKNAIDYVFEKTYSKKNMGNIFNKSYNQSNLVYKLLMYDPYGIKLFCYKIMDYLSPNKTKKIASFCLHKEPIEESFFNNKHNHWCYPIDMDLISDESFDDVYKKAIKRAVELIKATNKYISNKLSEEELLNSIKNYNYMTGVDCKDKRIHQYFEF